MYHTQIILYIHHTTTRAYRHTCRHVCPRVRLLYRYTCPCYPSLHRPNYRSVRRPTDLPAPPLGLWDAARHTCDTHEKTARTVLEHAHAPPSAVQSVQYDGFLSAEWAITLNVNAQQWRKVIDLITSRQVYRGTVISLFLTPRGRAMRLLGAGVCLPLSGHLFL